VHHKTHFYLKKIALNKNKDAIIFEKDNVVFVYIIFIVIVR